MATEAKTGLTLWPSGAIQQDLLFNALLLLVAASGYRPSVIDKDLATPPGAPAAGDAYIVAGSPTGAWAGWAGRVAYFDDTSWRSFIPAEGYTVAVLDENIDYRFSGSAWEMDPVGGFTAGALSVLSGAAGDSVFLRGDGTATNWLNGDFRVGANSGLFGSGREAVVSAGTTGDNISHLSLQGSRTTAGATFGAIQFYHQANRVASLVGFRDGADDAGGVIISTKATGAAILAALRINGNGTVRPGTDNSQELGEVATRWMTSHVVNQHQYGARFETGAVSPAQLTANTDNWVVTGLSTASIVRASTNASRNLTGIASPTSGQVFNLVNVGAFDLVLVHDATSTAANRFLCPNSANLTLNPNDSVRIWYDPTSSRFRVLGV